MKAFRRAWGPAAGALALLAVGCVGTGRGGGAVAGPPSSTAPTAGAVTPPSVFEPTAWGGEPAAQVAPRPPPPEDVPEQPASRATAEHASPPVHLSPADGTVPAPETEAHDSSGLGKPPTG